MDESEYYEGNTKKNGDCGNGIVQLKITKNMKRTKEYVLLLAKQSEKRKGNWKGS